MVLEWKQSKARWDEEETVTVTLEPDEPLTEHMLIKPGHLLADLEPEAVTSRQVKVVRGHPYRAPRLVDQRGRRILIEL